MSRTLSMNCGSGESLNACVWCGFSPNARQMRLTADCDMPVAAAIDLVDQCVASFGLSSSVFTITRSTSSSPIERGLPGPRLVMEPINATAGEAAPPPPDRGAVAAKLSSDLGTRATLRRSQHDPTTKRQRLRTLRPPSPPLKRLPLLLSQHRSEERRVGKERSTREA